MENNGLHLDIETVVAILFGITAIATVAMTTWAYIYQRTRELKNAETGTVRGNQGQFFIRVRPE